MSEAAPAERLRAPFPYFGGKSRAAPLIWPRFGCVPNYVEPFFGSGAVLLARPHPPGTETVNDYDCMVANFWRSLVFAPEAVADFADWPVNEADLHARHAWLVNQTEFRERMMTDPDHYDPKIAGWWVWGKSTWIAGGWCSAIEEGVVPSRSIPAGPYGSQGIHGQAFKIPKRSLPAAAGQGIHRKIPMNHDVGVHTLSRSIPRSINAGVNTAGAAEQGVQEMLYALARRLRNVRVVCGDWERVVQPSYVGRNVTAILLDPPYYSDLSEGLYSHADASISMRVRQWAIKNGEDPNLRIALCGYEGEHKMPDTWEKVEWKATGGFGLQRRDGTNQNQERERIWFSPACLKPSDSLFSDFGFETGDEG